MKTKTKIENYLDALNSLGFGTPSSDDDSGTIILDSGDIIELSKFERGGKVSTEDRKVSFYFSGVSDLIEILSGGKVVYTTAGETDEF